MYISTYVCIYEQIYVHINGRTYYIYKRLFTPTLPQTLTLLLSPTQQQLQEQAEEFF